MLLSQSDNSCYEVLVCWVVACVIIVAVGLFSRTNNQRIIPARKRVIVHCVAYDVLALPLVVVARY